MIHGKRRNNNLNETIFSSNDMLSPQHSKKRSFPVIPVVDAATEQSLTNDEAAVLRSQKSGAPGSRTARPGQVFLVVAWLFTTESC